MGRPRDPTDYTGTIRRCAVPTRNSAGPDRLLMRVGTSHSRGTCRAVADQAMLISPSCLESLPLLQAHSVLRVACGIHFRALTLRLRAGCRF